MACRSETETGPHSVEGAIIIAFCCETEIGLLSNEGLRLSVVRLRWVHSQLRGCGFNYHCESWFHSQLKEL